MAFDELATAIANSFGPVTRFVENHWLIIRVVMVCFLLLLFLAAIVYGIYAFYLSKFKWDPPQPPHEDKYVDLTCASQIRNETVDSFIAQIMTVCNTNISVTKS